jgi:uncharacterized damage-inducible protein DinB
VTLIEMFQAQLEAEAKRTRAALERVPEGKDDWTPHPKSMPLGRLAMLVARMPTWFGLIVNQDDLELNPPAGSSNVDQRPLKTASELVQAHDEGVEQARTALRSLDEERLAQPWRLRVSGNVVSAEPRHVVIRDTFAHLAHHRGQLTVYLRLNNAPVPAIYGPSADDQRFA